jgi:L-aspartate oxidase
VRQSDFLIIGSGVAGLSVALNLAEHGIVHIVTKKDLTDSNTNLAQGGIASVFDPGDSFELHARDTLLAGAGLCRREVVDLVVREGPERIRDLRTLGVPFTTTGGTLSLGLEGGHSRNRIVHCHDLTGREVERHLVDAVLAHPQIEVFRHHMAVNLIGDRHLRVPAGGSDAAIHGAYVLDAGSGGIDAFSARRTILATGGAGKVYLYTSNPDIATGDGIAMACRAGARVANMEFVQFHPTCLYHPQVRSFLLSEALRGEGGRLIDEGGAAFMERYSEARELAPRDVVARAIDAEMKRTGAQCVYLDMTHKPGPFLEERFPHIFRTCFDLGIDMRTEPIPVVPATHYFCGGVDVDTHARASVRNLLAVGEVSHTGLHGANRLASNSLLEALVFAKRAHDGALLDFTRGQSAPEPMPWEEEATGESIEGVILEHDWDEARRLMWDYVGIVRSDQRLTLARDRMRALSETVHSLYWNSRVSQDLLELRNIILVGELIIRSALSRRESRGLHYTESHPDRDDEHFLHDTILDTCG